MMGVNSNGESYFTVYIDGKRVDERIGAKGVKNVKIASFEGNYFHVIRIVRQNEIAWSQSLLKNLTITGYLFEAPEERKLYFEFFGDSLTSAFGNIGKPSDPAPHDVPKYQDATQSYAYLVAEALNADCSILAMSGVGIATGHYEKHFLHYFSKFSHKRDNTEFSFAQAAFDAGADYIVLMDDDGRAADEHTFARLFCEAERLHAENPRLFVNSLVFQGELLSFKMGNKYTVAEALAAAKDGILEGEANPFNGTLVSRELVAEIGYPNPDFFIKGDEVNYKQRAFDAGAKVVTVVDSRYIHPRPETNERIVLGKKVPFFVEAPWKEYYAARNFTYMYKQNGWYKAIAFELVFVKLLAVLTMKCKKVATVKMLAKGVKDGWQGKLGATVKP